MADNAPGLPADDLSRRLTVAEAEGPGMRHVSVAGDTYTTLVSGRDSGGRFCLIDMHIPPGGGPPPHRHDFEETFHVLEGEIEVMFRGEKTVAKAGVTVNVPANAPHAFKNVSGKPARLLCLCAPAGQEEFFAEVGDAVATRTSAPPKLSEAEKRERQEKAMKLAAKFKTEILVGE